MNMRALVLHVLGDALGNVGVIATGLIIMLAPASWNGREVYFDPAISLVIACIILGSAVPLGASFLPLLSFLSPILLDVSRYYGTAPPSFLFCPLIVNRTTHTLTYASNSPLRVLCPPARVRAAILAAERVLGPHELHIWQVRRLELR
jgi:Co/Zn/Cd efflux system component